VADDLQTYTVVERDNPARLAALAKPTVVQSGGLNPYLLELNKHMHAARLLKGSSLSPDEVTDLRAGFRALWAEIADHDVYEEAYQQYLVRPAQQPQSKAGAYRPSWGGGCNATPFTKHELHQHIAEFGWPRNSQVRDDDCEETRAARDSTSDFHAASQYNLWGIGRWAHNVDRSSVKSSVQFDIVHRGLFGFIEHHVGKAASDEADVMVIVSGKSVFNNRHCVRVAGLITGTCYCPKVFDVTRLRFEHDSDSTSVDLQLPCFLKIGERNSLISDNFEVNSVQTSDEFVYDLTESMVDMQLHWAQYEVVDRDNSLLWSRLDGIQDLGILWEVGQKVPLDFAQHRNTGGASRRDEKLFKAMASSDPLSERPRTLNLAQAFGGTKRIV
jgi:hypothetical protein